MKSLLKYLIAFTFFAIAIETATAQDIIIKVNDDSLNVKIVQITFDKIRYRFHGMKTGNIMEIPKNQVKKIIYENGSSLTIVYNLFDVNPDLLIKDRSRSWKIDLVSPVFNHFTIGYEQKLKLGMNLEIKASYIGWRLNKTIDQTDGFFVKAGIKFLKNSSTIRKGLKYMNPMKGSYLKPEITAGRYTSIEKERKINFTNIAVNCLFGQQYIIGNVICLDLFGGAGVGYQYNSRGPSNREDDFSYCFSHIFFGKKLPITLTGGFMIGYVF